MQNVKISTAELCHFSSLSFLSDWSPIGRITQYWVTNADRLSNFYTLTDNGTWSNRVVMGEQEMLLPKKSQPVLSVQRIIMGKIESYGHFEKQMHTRLF